jgi:hypothetical protein
VDVLRFSQIDTFARHMASQQARGILLLEQNIGRKFKYDSSVRLYCQQYYKRVRYLSIGLPMSFCKTRKIALLLVSASTVAEIGHACKRRVGNLLHRLGAVRYNSDTFFFKEQTS